MRSPWPIPAALMVLDLAPLASIWRVKRLHCVEDPDNPVLQQLEDLGFLPGEQVSVTARAWPAGDPLVVRVGMSSFAIRRLEARCVELLPLENTAPGHA